ncbi:hypothetical protein HWV00_12150 [Moritella sp. 24]|uniref:DUF6434 domain-containing protein n=1 Tax=Moritella sp. 24 TaxID=2746230 RepID=UPI001BA44F14|nr:DUF6434 domain-containing protein [Moritella sp. 24]QUM76930.1 hypothetical protein HWV00_12150 [Moritella sp. 24]
MDNFDWHKSDILDCTVINHTYKHTQNVRRYFKVKCGDGFKFDRGFMLWMKNAEGSTMEDAAQEWLIRQVKKKDQF